MTQSFWKLTKVVVLVCSFRFFPSPSGNRTQFLRSPKSAAKLSERWPNISLVYSNNTIKIKNQTQRYTKHFKGPKFIERFILYSRNVKWFLHPLLQTLMIMQTNDVHRFGYSRIGTAVESQTEFDIKQWFAIHSFNCLPCLTCIVE